MYNQISIYNSLKYQPIKYHYNNKDTIIIGKSILLPTQSEFKSDKMTILTFMKSKNLSTK